MKMPLQSLNLTFHNILNVNFYIFRIFLVSVSKRAKFSIFIWGSDPIMNVCMYVNYISSVSFDARKEIIRALDRVIPC